jgi:hypothetical protein
MSSNQTNDDVQAAGRGLAFHDDQFDVRVAKRCGKDLTADEDAVVSESDLVHEAALTALTTEQERKLLRKIDWRLIPMLCMLYLVKKLDESNVRPTAPLVFMDEQTDMLQVSNARIMNKGTDANILTQLNMSSDQYGLVTVLFTVSIRD